MLTLDLVTGWVKPPPAGTPGPDSAEHSTERLAVLVRSLSSLARMRRSALVT